MVRKVCQEKWNFLGLAFGGKKARAFFGNVDH
jgi:hypothetical protein